MTFKPGLSRNVELALCFVRSRAELATAVACWCSTIWIVFPKKSGQYKVDFNRNDVRAAGLSAGLVDYKLCSVDDDWSGLKFTRRSAEKSPATS